MVTIVVASTDNNGLDVYDYVGETDYTAVVIMEVVGWLFSDFLTILTYWTDSSEMIPISIGSD